MPNESALAPTIIGEAPRLDGIPESMRAARRDRYGSPDVIRVEQIPVPKPTAEQVLIRVHAATVSRTDYALLCSRPFFMRLITGPITPKLKTLGTDFAGEVVEVGANVTAFRVGDRVFGIQDLGVGSHAEFFVAAPSEAMTGMPEGQRFEEAAASVEGGWYAYSVIRRVGGVAPGARVLINGATGAIGSALLQFCVDRKASVTAVGNTKNVDLLKSLGADRVIDYAACDFTQEAEPGAYDYVFDSVGKSTFGACKRLLKPGGTYCSSELGPGWQNVPLALITPALGGKKVVFPVPVPKGEYLSFIRSLVEAGRFRPVIDRRYALDDIQEAYRYADSGQKTGSVVLTLAGPSALLS